MRIFLDTINKDDYSQKVDVSDMQNHAIYRVSYPLRLFPDTFGRHIAFLHCAVRIVNNFLYTYRTAVACSFRKSSVMGEEICLSVKFHDRRVGCVAVACTF